MTKINKLILHGFKSFAKRTELLFGDKFNCILGPNGSGKSNVLDALCFVLGTSSAKTLRAEKSSNLIYNGGKTKQAMKSAEVSIFFDNFTKEFPTEDKEVKITRIVKEDGQSKYKINDKTRTRQQVLDLLSIAKIDPDGYNIILQGDINAFTEMPAVNRRQIVEQIAGIGIYEEKKQKSMNELAKVEQNLNESGIILAERKTYLRDLKKDRDQAAKYKDMNDKINQNRASYTKINIDKKEKERKDIEDKIKDIKEKLQKINNQITESKNSNIEREKEIDNLTKEIEEKGEIEQLKLTKGTETLKIELATNLARKDLCKSEIEKLKKRINELNSNTKQTEERINDLKSRADELKKEKETKGKDKIELEKTISEFRKKNNLETESKIEKNLDEFEKRIDEEQKKVQELREQQHNLLREKDKIELQIKSFEETIKKVSEIEKQHQGELKELEQKRVNFKKTVEDLNKKLSEDSYLSYEISKLKESLRVEDEELQKLKTKELALSDSIKSDIAVKKILEKKSKGIYGTVADLIDVDAKYAIAVEIAIGPRIKSIVVDTDKTAAECIDYLKQNQIGTATFMPLNKIKPGKVTAEAEKISKKEGSYGFANQLIKYDSRFSAVFEHLLANTIVVDNIDSARKLGIGNAKMVTLDGDVTELSGVMQGGFRKIKSNLERKDILKRIEEKEISVKETENKIEIMVNRRKEVEKNIEELRLLKSEIEGDVIKTEKSLHLDSSDMDISKKKKEELENGKTSIDNKLNEANNQINVINRNLIELKTKKQQLRDEISKLRNPEVLAELNAFSDKEKEISESILIISSELTNIETQTKEIFMPEIEKAKKIIQQHNKEIKDFEKEQQELEQFIKQKEVEVVENEKKEKEFRSKYKSLFDKRSKLKEEIHKTEIEITKTEGLSKEFEIKDNNHALKRAEINAYLSVLNEEFEKYHGVEILTSKTEDELKNEINKFERMREEIGTVNMRALEVYDEVEKEYNTLLSKKERLESEKNDVMKLMEEIEKKKKDIFMETLIKVNDNFVTIFTSLSKAGEAYLELEDKENPFNGGLKIKVRITSDKFLDIRSLSGGEKALTALAFIFTLQEYEPASFYILDEVDAALDKKNSENLSRLIKKYSEHAQYVIISHNDSMITEAETIYGVSMDEFGVSKSIGIRL